MKEKFVRINTIEGYNNIKDCYWMSNSDEDKIINRSTQRQMKICIDKKGYKVVRLMTIDGKRKTCKIHVIKAAAFIYSPNPLSYNIVRHLNDIKTDNRLENLAWGTFSDNMQDCIRNGRFNYNTAVKNGKKISKPVKCIETGKYYASAKEASRLTGINNGNINACCSGKRKTAGRYKWEFVDKQE